MQISIGYLQLRQIASIGKLYVQFLDADTTHNIWRFPMGYFLEEWSSNRMPCISRLPPFLYNSVRA